MEPKVSIIVPVYNAEKSLARCVDSILNQEFRDFELILMDDGSKDRSGEICDGYARADARVVVVHKENTGVSDTRNQAIARARGTFLQFVDSDDWLTPDATETFVYAAQKFNCDGAGGRGDGLRHGDRGFLSCRRRDGVAEGGYRRGPGDRA